MSSQDNKSKDVGVVVATHTDYGEHLLAAAEMILGQQKGCRAVPVDMGHGMDEIVESLKKAVESVDAGAGVLILTDMFGGTPTNISLSLLGTYKLEVITGVNLPMLLKVLGMRSMSLAKVAEEAKNAGMQGIVVAGEVLRKKVAGG
ncbi:PTS sugar transporter subunit IIA [Desulfocurvus sp. DL9XJH121]